MTAQCVSSLAVDQLQRLGRRGVRRPRGDDLIAYRPAKRTSEVARGHSPFASIYPDVGAIDGGGSVAARGVEEAEAAGALGSTYSILRSSRRSRRQTVPRSGAALPVRRRRSRAPEARRTLATAGICVRARRQDGPDKPLDVVAAVHEIAGEPVEHARRSMARRPFRLGWRPDRGRAAAARCGSRTCAASGPFDGR